MQRIRLSYVPLAAVALAALFSSLQVACSSRAVDDVTTEDNLTDDSGYGAKAPSYNGYAPGYWAYEGY